MSDDRVVAFLRARGKAPPPPDLVSRVMTAVDAVPVRRSRFAAFVPVVAVTGAIAIVAVLAVLIGEGLEVGPPERSDSPSPTSSSSTTAELEAAIDAGLDALRDAPGVEGTATSWVLGELSGATWFSWRPNGDQVVITRTDVDVAESGWWLDPTGEPPARGRNVSTAIHVFVAEDAFVTDAGAWLSQDRADAPPSVTLATGLLDDVIDVGDMLFVDPAAAEVTVVRTVDGAATWSLAAPYGDGTATAVWELAADGTLRSWSYELTDVVPSLWDRAPVTSHRTEFMPLADPGPIEAPDTDARPDPASLGLPADFPLGRDASGGLHRVAHVEAALYAL